MEWRKNKNIIFSILFIFGLAIAPLVFLQLYGEQSKNKISPELSGITGWINSGPMSLADLRGKVVIVDFWTYSCINCLRTIPYLNAWYKQYRDLGLVIIGVHSPEFSFEKESDRVEKAVKELGIQYPVAMDDNHKTWDAFGNRFWPHKYFIGADGNVRYEVIGEGRYEESEDKIRELLAETNQALSVPRVSVSSDPVIASNIGTPEIYFGTFHGGFIGNPKGILAGNEKKFLIPDKMEPNVFYLEGNWEIGEEYARHTGRGRGEIKIEYRAKSVNWVAGVSGAATRVEVRLDGHYLRADEAGRDIQLSPDGVSTVSISDKKLYNLVNTKAGYGSHLLELITDSPYIESYTLTFG